MASMIILKLNIFAWEGLADESAISDELKEGGLTILPKDLKPKQVSQYFRKRNVITSSYYPNSFRKLYL